MLIKTDCLSLTPEPLRGRRNEPAYVRYTAEEIARGRGLSYEELGFATSRNALDFFRVERKS